jgi:hypothetical protein
MAPSRDRPSTLISRATQATQDEDELIQEFAQFTDDPRGWVRSSFPCESAQIVRMKDDESSIPPQGFHATNFARRK